LERSEQLPGEPSNFEMIDDFLDAGDVGQKVEHLMLRLAR
jgi:hypothetical protein